VTPGRHGGTGKRTFDMKIEAVRQIQQMLAAAKSQH
jgi:hypothetical protein